MLKFILLIVIFNVLSKVHFFQMKMIEFSC